MFLVPPRARFSATARRKASGGGGGDPNFANVSLLLHMDGTNGSTSFPDSSTTAHTVTAVGNAQVTTTDPKFGTGALLLDGNGDYLSIPSSTALTLGTSDFTIETWVNFAAIGNQSIFSQRGFGGFSLKMIDDGRLQGLTPSLVSSTEQSVSVVINTWYHVAFTRLGSDYKLWVNGVNRSVSTFAGENGLSGTSYVGLRAIGQGEFLNGKVDDLRVTKGVARYTTNFTPPAAAFPDN